MQGPCPRRAAAVVLAGRALVASSGDDSGSWCGRARTRWNAHVPGDANLKSRQRGVQAQYAYAAARKAPNTTN
uniref:Uncharacterized protein n=1 Tax=Leishmania guyanensis TaxID=5670 RepID=A0A1E1J9F4_LEIGU|nr:Hypothetical protein BN36_NA77590 [Leishmania guyanensis]